MDFVRGLEPRDPEKPVKVNSDTDQTNSILILFPP